MSVYLSNCTICCFFYGDEKFLPHDKKFPEAHTAENLAEVLLQAIEEWELASKVYGFSTDNEMNMVNAVINHLRVIHLPCIGHTIQLAVEKAFCLQDIESALRKVLKLVG